MSTSADYLMNRFQKKSIDLPVIRMFVPIGGEFKEYSAIAFMIHILTDTVRVKVELELSASCQLQDIRCDVDTSNGHAEPRCWMI